MRTTLTAEVTTSRREEGTRSLYRKADLGFCSDGIVNMQQLEYEAKDAPWWVVIVGVVIVSSTPEAWANALRRASPRKDCKIILVIMVMG